MPNKFNPVSAGTALPNAIAQFNKNFAELDREAVTKKFGSGDNQVIIGKAGDNVGLVVGESAESQVIVGKTDPFVGMVVGDIASDAIIYGIYQVTPETRFGTLHLENGVPVELSGQAPDDGRMGHWIAAPGENVIELLGGTW